MPTELSELQKEGQSVKSVKCRKEQKYGWAYCPKCGKTHRSFFPTGYPGKWGRSNNRLPWQHCQSCKKKIQEYADLDSMGTLFHKKSAKKSAGT